MEQSVTIPTVTGTPQNSVAVAHRPTMFALLARRGGLVRSLGEAQSFLVAARSGRSRGLYRFELLTLSTRLLTFVFVFLYLFLRNSELVVVLVNVNQSRGGGVSARF